MDFRILGPLEVHAGDRPVAVGGLKQRMLLASLLLNANEVVSSDRLIEDLWEGERLENASKALQVAVTRLRRTLEPERASGRTSSLLVTRPPGYELRLARDQLDLHRFEDELDAGRQALAVGDPALAAERLARALAMWRGPPLADLTHESFPRADIARMEELRMSALEERIAADLALGRHAAVVAELSELVGRHPVRERLREQLMLALYRCGRQAEALDVYSDARRALTDELGIDPGRDLQELQQAVLRQDPILDRCPPRAAAARAGPSGTFAGRDRERAGAPDDAIKSKAASELHERGEELAAIYDGWQSARAGAGRLVIVEGPPGIGKTGLLRAARAAIEPEAVQVLAARAGELERHFPFGLVHQLLDPIVYAAATEERDLLFGGAAQLAAGLFSHEQASGGGSAEVFPRLHGLFWLMANIAGRRPLLVTIDDAQWADDASLAFLAFLARRLEDTPILLVIATRPVRAEGRDLLAQLVGDPSGRVLRPATLSRAAVARWLDAALSEEVDSTFVDACHATTRGNPLLVSELLREFSAGGLSPSAAGAREVGAVASDGIAAVVLLRLAGMPASARQLAGCVAVLGDGTDLWSAAELARLEQADAAVALHALVQGGLLTEGDGHALGFSHPSIRSAVYQDLGPAERAGAHERAARLLQARHARPDEVAAHLLVTRPRGDAAVVAVLREAARGALALGAADAADAYLRRALLEPPTGELAAEVCAELGRAAARSGACDAEDHLRHAMALAGTASGRCRAALQLARWLKFAGRAAEAVAIIDAALSEGDAPEAELADELAGELVTLAFVSRSAQELLRHRLDLDLDGRGGELAVLGMAARACVLASTGASAAAAAAEARRAYASARAPADPVAAGYWSVMAGVAALWSDRFDLSERLIGGMLAEARRSGSAGGMRVASALRSMLQFRRGDLPDAESDARFVLSLADEFRGHDAWVSVAYAMLAQVAVERAAPREALQQLLVDLGDPRVDTDALSYQQFLYSRGCLRVALGDEHGGLEDFHTTGKFAREWGAVNPSMTPWRSEAALVASRLGQRELARTLAAKELELARGCGAPRALGIALRAEALVSADGTTESLLAEAVAVLEDSGARLEHARALIDLGAVVRRDGRRDHARGLLRRGLEIAAHCRADQLAQRGRDELLATGARPRRIALSAVESLTPSERHVAELAADGLGNRAIAQELFVTEKTVEGHLAHAFDKLGVRSRTGLREALGETKTPAASDH